MARVRILAAALAALACWFATGPNALYADPLGLGSTLENVGQTVQQVTEPPAPPPSTEPATSPPPSNPLTGSLETVTAVTETVLPSDAPPAAPAPAEAPLTPVTEALAPVLEAPLAPVTQTLAPVTEAPLAPVTQTLAPVTGALEETLIRPVNTLVDETTTSLDATTGELTETLTQVAPALTRPVDEALEPLLGEEQDLVTQTVSGAIAQVEALPSTSQLTDGITGPGGLLDPTDGLLQQLTQTLAPPPAAGDAPASPTAQPANPGLGAPSVQVEAHGDSFGSEAPAIVSTPAERVAAPVFPASFDSVVPLVPATESHPTGRSTTPIRAVKLAGATNTAESQPVTGPQPAPRGALPSLLQGFLRTSESGGSLFSASYAAALFAAAWALAATVLVVRCIDMRERPRSLALVPFYPPD
jgi:hypothetical protein